MLGHSLALEMHDLHRLGVGAMLHDIGKVSFLDLARKPALTPEEWETMKRHTLEGFRLLRDQSGIDLRTAHIALQHHERLDGSGYPRGLSGDAIHPWTQLTAVVDVFDTITADRPHGAGLPPHLAMAELESMARGGKLDPRLVRHLTWRLAAYPEGTILLLESGEVGVVVGQSPLGGHQPRVHVLCDEHLHLVPASVRVLEARAPGDTLRTVLADYPPKLFEQMQAAAPQG